MGLRKNQTRGDDVYCATRKDFEGRKQMSEVTREELEDWIAFIRTATATWSTGIGTDIWDARIDTILTLALERLDMEPPLQDRVKPWMDACFGTEISSDRLERSDRLIEEAFELLQSGNYPRERVLALVDYVWDRPQGEINQEVGGVMITLAAYCLAFGLDMHEAGEIELARIWTKIDKIRAKQAAKPTGSALPIPLSSIPKPKGT